MLFTAGLLASRGYLDIVLTCILLFAAAVLGDTTGYKIGEKFGKRLFHKEDSLLFHKDHLLRAKNFYDKYGGKTIILARFMPIIRTFAPVVAGIAEMPYKRFLSFNIIGALLWAVGITLAGYFLGRVIPDVDSYLLPIILVIVILSIGPGIYEILNTPQKRQNAKHFLRSSLNRVRKNKN